MATTLFLRNTTSASTAATPAHLDLLTSAGAAEQSATVTTVSSGTEIQWTRSGGLALTFASPRIGTAGVTLAQAASITYSLWGKESGNGVNASFRAKLFQRSRSGTETLINSADFASEFTTSLGEKVWTGTLTSAFSLIEDERLLLRIYARNQGNMGAGTCHLTYNGAGAANGDSQIVYSANTTFKAESDPGVLVTSNATLSSSLDGLLQKTFTQTSSLDAQLYASMGDGLGFDAFLQPEVTGTNTAALSLDALLSKTVTKSASFDGLLQGAETPVASLDAALYRTFAPTASADAVLEGAGTATMVLSSNWTGLLEKQGVERATLLEGLIEKVGTLMTTVMDAVVEPHIGDVMLAVALDSIVHGEEQAAVLMGLHHAYEEEELRRRRRHQQELEFRRRWR